MRKLGIIRLSIGATVLMNVAGAWMAWDLGMFSRSKVFVDVIEPFPLLVFISAKARGMTTLEMAIDPVWNHLAPQSTRQCITGERGPSRFEALCMLDGSAVEEHAMAAGELDRSLSADELRRLFGNGVNVSLQERSVKRVLGQKCVVHSFLVNCGQGRIIVAEVARLPGEEAVLEVWAWAEKGSRVDVGSLRYSKILAFGVQGAVLAEKWLEGEGASPERQ